MVPCREVLPQLREACTEEADTSSSAQSAFACLRKPGMVQSWKSEPLMVPCREVLPAAEAGKDRGGQHQQQQLKQQRPINSDC